MSVKSVHIYPTSWRQILKLCIAPHSSEQQLFNTMFRFILATLQPKLELKQNRTLRKFQKKLQFFADRMPSKNIRSVYFIYYIMIFSVISDRILSAKIFFHLRKFGLLVPFFERLIFFLYFPYVQIFTICTKFVQI